MKRSSLLLIIAIIYKFCINCSGKPDKVIINQSENNTLFDEQKICADLILPQPIENMNLPTLGIDDIILKIDENEILFRAVNINNKKKEHKFKLNDSEFINIGKYVYYKPWVTENQLNFYALATDSIFFYNYNLLNNQFLKTNAIENRDYEVIYYNFHEKELIVCNRYDKTLSKFDYINDNMKIIYSFDDNQLSKEYELIDVFNFNGKKNNILMQFGIFNGGYYNLKYFLYDLTSNSIKNITERLKVLNQLSREIIFSISDGTRNLISVYIEDGSIKTYIIDNEYNIIRSVMSSKIFSENIVGYSYLNQKMNLLYIMNNSNKVISYDLNFLVESAFSTIYEQKKLTEEDVKSLNNNELKLLIDFIYAIKNYDFEDNEIEDYFNLYNFYSNFKDSRVKLPVFTRIDSMNLCFLQKKLK